MYTSIVQLYVHPQCYICTHRETHCRPVARGGGAKGTYAPPPFARDACRRQPASACARGRTRDSHAFFFLRACVTVRFVKEKHPPTLGPGYGPALTYHNYCIQLYTQAGKLMLLIYM